MGNKHAASGSTNTNSKHTNKVTALRSKFKRNSVSIDTFFIEYCQTNKKNDSQIDINSLDIRRAVFVSTMGLYHTWKQCPSVVLYTALLALPLKRMWIYNPSKYHRDIATFADIDPAETKEFLSMLRWKDSQGLICWMLDKNPATDNSHDIHPIWDQMNDKLQSLYDPITDAKYNKIELNSAYWNSASYISKYDVANNDILAEICCPSLKFSIIQEMIHQSNPLSLVPMISYSEDSDVIFVKTPLEDEYDEDNEDDIGGWWISSDYDPNDIKYDFN